MTRKHIDIQGYNIKTGPWISTVSAAPFTFIESGRVTFAAVERNYYLDTKKDKIRSRSTTNDRNRSYKHLYYVYMEVYPGIFAFCNTATEDSLTDIIERYKKIYIENDYPNNPAVDEWRNSLIRK